MVMAKVPLRASLSQVILGALVLCCAFVLAEGSSSAHEEVAVDSSHGTEDSTGNATDHGAAGHEEHHCYAQVKVGADVVGFVLIASATGYIGYKNVAYRGPSNNERYFNGFREENMIGFFVNLFAAVSYFARILANSQCVVGFQMLTHIRYADYLTTCPLLVLDLLWNLEAPYKCTCGGLILVTILTGVAACSAQPPESYLWFAYGDIIFIITYSILVVIVRERMQFFVARAKTNSALKAMYYVKFACCCFFCIWVWYPMLWIVSPYCLNLISVEVNDLLHMFLDVCAKSVYGIVLMWFRWNYDKNLLRNLDEQEFLAFSSKSDKEAADAEQLEQQQAQAPKVVEDGPFRFTAISEPGEGPFSFAVPRDDTQRSPEPGYRNANGLVVPFAPSTSSYSGPEDGRRSPLGTRSMVGSARYTQSQSPQGSPMRRPSNAPSIPRMREVNPGQGRDMERWLAELGVFLEDHGLNSPHAVATTLARLEQAGVTEELLRTCITDEDLQEMGIDLAARRVILGRYGRAAPSAFGGGGGGMYASEHGSGWSPRALT